MRLEFYEPFFLRYRTEGSIPREILVGLHSILGDVVISALDLVDRRSVYLLSESEGPRAVYLVQGSRGVKYNVKKFSHYCSCPSFQVGDRTRSRHNYEQNRG